jgi:chromate transporter
MKPGILATLATHFLGLSVLAFGGANAVIPEIHRDAVEVSHWMTDQQFADLFAISQASPGPNILIVTLVGFQVAGVAGALVATAAMCGPPCVFVYFAGRVWHRFRHARWRIVVQAGLVPVSIGLIAAAAMVLARRRSHLGRRAHHAGDRGPCLCDPHPSTVDVRRRRLAGAGGPCLGRRPGPRRIAPAKRVRILRSAIMPWNENIGPEAGSHAAIS